MSKKKEASEVASQFLKCFERQTGHYVITFHTNGGREFFKVQKNIKNKGANIYYTTAFKMRSNGLSNAVILGLARAILQQANIPIKYWNFAISHAVL